MRARRCRWSLSRWQSTFVVGAIHLRHNVSPSLSQSLSHLSPSITSVNLFQTLQNANRTSRLVDSLHKAAKVLELEDVKDKLLEILVNLKSIKQMEMRIGFMALGRFQKRILDIDKLYTAFLTDMEEVLAGMKRSHFSINASKDSAP